MLCRAPASPLTPTFARCGTVMSSLRRKLGDNFCLR